MLVADEAARWSSEGGAPQPALGADLDRVIRAEQALLGGVLCDPGQASVLGLVSPADMLRPYHGQVLAAMQRLQAAGSPPDPLRLRDELSADPDLPRRVALDGILIANLMEAAPRPEHAPAYAAMVIEHSIRRQVVLAASRISQAARSDPDAVHHVLSQAGRAIRACQARWHALPPRLRPDVPARIASRADQAEEAAWHLAAARDAIEQASQAFQAAGTPDTDPSATQQNLATIARHVASAAAASQPTASARPRAARAIRPRGPAAEAAGERALRDLVAGSGQIPQIRAWLQPAHFASPHHAQLYALMRDMHQAGAPVDAVTVTWEAARRGIATSPAALEGGTPGFAVSSAREVRAHARVAQIGQAGRDLASAARDPRPTVTRLLQASASRLRSLEREIGLAPRPPARETSGRRLDRTRLEPRRAVEPEPSPEAAL